MRASSVLFISTAATQRLVALGVVVASVLVTATAHAQERAVLEPPPQVGQRTFGMLARVGVDGAYGGVRVGSARFGVEGTAGYAPVLALQKNVEPWWPYHDARYFSSAQINGELFAFPWRTQNKVQFGFDGHYSYNTLLLSGVGAAFRFDIAISRTLVGGLRVGGTWFPSANDQVAKNSPPDVEVNKLFTQMQGFASFELAWFPM